LTLFSNRKPRCATAVSAVFNPLLKQTLTSRPFLKPALSTAFQNGSLALLRMKEYVNIPNRRTPGLKEEDV
jgi:hypothetical protein